MYGGVWTCVDVCFWPLPGFDFCSVTLSPWSPPRSIGWALVVVVTHSALQLGRGKGAKRFCERLSVIASIN